MIKFSSIMCLTLHQTPDKAEPSLVPVPWSERSENEVGSNHLTPTTKLLKIRDFLDNLQTQAIHLAFITVKKQRFLRFQTREVNEINCGHRCNKSEALFNIYRFLKENIKLSNTKDKLKATRTVKTTTIDLISKKTTLHVQHTFFSN